jgi:hypothetical protein
VTGQIIAAVRAPCTLPKLHRAPHLPPKHAKNQNGPSAGGNWGRRWIVPERRLRHPRIEFAAHRKFNQIRRRPVLKK